MGCRRAMGCFPMGYNPTKEHHELDPGAAATRLRRGFLSDPPVQPFIGPRLTLQNETKGFPSGGKERPSRGRP